MLEPYVINCGGKKVVPPICGFFVWGEGVGEITDQTDLIEYLVDNYQPLNAWLTDISELMLVGQPGDMFVVNSNGEIVRLPNGTNGDILQTIGGQPTWNSLADALESVSLDDLGDVYLELVQEGDFIRYVDGEWTNVTLLDILSEIDFGDLNDVNFTSLSNGDFVRWNGSTSNWVNVDIEDIVTSLSSVMSLDDLANVSTADAAATGSVLRKTAGDWQATTPAALAGSINLNDLADVVITSAANGEVLRFNGTNWVDATLTTGDITNNSNLSGGTLTNALNSADSRLDALETAPPPSSGAYRGTSVQGNSASSGVISFSGLAGGINTEGSNVWSAGQPNRLVVPSGVTLIRLHYYVYVGSNVTMGANIRQNGSGSAMQGTFGAADQTVGGTTAISVTTRALATTPGTYYQLWADQGVTDAFFEMEILG